MSERRTADTPAGPISHLWRDGMSGAGGIVFLHGLCGGAVHFDRAFDDPSLESHDLCAVDLPGFGDSQTATFGSLEDCANAVAAVMEVAGFARPPWLVAHSMSASIAVRLLDRIAGLTLLEGNVSAAHLDVSDRIIAQDPADYPAYFARLQATAELVVRHETRVRDPVARQRYAATWRACGADLVWQVAKMINQDVRRGGILDALATARLPVTCVCGAETTYADGLPADAAFLAVDEVPGAGHFPMLDQPAATYALIARHMKMELQHA